MSLDLNVPKSCHETITVLCLPALGFNVDPTHYGISRKPPCTSGSNPSIVGVKIGVALGLLILALDPEE